MRASEVVAKIESLSNEWSSTVTESFMTVNKDGLGLTDYLNDNFKEFQFVSISSEVYGYVKNIAVSRWIRNQKVSSFKVIVSFYDGEKKTDSVNSIELDV